MGDELRAKLLGDVQLLTLLKGTKCLEECENLRANERVSVEKIAGEAYLRVVRCWLPSYRVELMLDHFERPVGTQNLRDEPMEHLQTRSQSESVTEFTAVATAVSE